MTSTGYVTFLVFATVLVLVPGPDFAVVVRNTLAGGRARGMWSTLGVVSAAVLQGVAAAAGLGALVLRVEPVFQAIRWAGIAYLVVLAAQSLRSAVRGDYAPLDGGRAGRGSAWAGWRQGFLSNITNPKVLVFYLAVLPQFLSPGAGIGLLIGYALSHAALGLIYLTGLTLLLSRARRLLARRAVRRGLDAATGVVLLAFGARLALERS
ncbi:Threonine/homoserine/homoserine lactone efflux protein [Modestobacter sp. DSM 44400]|uniref:LysE family translocator n=1 Tax=Modestobacter sp. DSM 44400 TaxID=1550230 RepID=UPI000895AE80|nr:LysE family translocator [Modestobacter sp. DSM 44400]SDY47060.1 Threonine/homoserine/homoserine lactone efflux protein [Modestobacter sp. DSM 44400]